MASQRGQLFWDEEFAELYCAHNGRDSVPPSLLATALLLQNHDRASDDEAKARADVDVRWKVVGVAVEEKPFAKSTLQLFRAHLILHEKVRAVFQRSLQFARKIGYLKGHRMKAAQDNTGALGLVKQSEENTDMEVEETIGDAAYGDGATRQAFADADRTLIAKVPGRPERAYSPGERHPRGEGLTLQIC